MKYFKQIRTIILIILLTEFVLLIFSGYLKINHIPGSIVATVFMISIFGAVLSLISLVAWLLYTFRVFREN